MELMLNCKVTNLKDLTYTDLPDWARKLIDTEFKGVLGKEFYLLEMAGGYSVLSRSAMLKSFPDLLDYSLMEICQGHDCSFWDINGNQFSLAEGRVMHHKTSTVVEPLLLSSDAFSGERRYFRRTK